MQNSTEKDNGYVEIQLGDDLKRSTYNSGVWIANTITVIHGIQNDNTLIKFAVNIFGSRSSYNVVEARIRYIRIK